MTRRAPLRRWLTPIETVAGRSVADGAGVAEMGLGAVVTTWRCSSSDPAFWQYVAVQLISLAQWSSTMTAFTLPRGTEEAALCSLSASTPMW